MPIVSVEDLVGYVNTDTYNMSDIQWNSRFYTSLLQRGKYDEALEFISSQEVKVNNVYSFTIGLNLDIPDYFLKSLAYMVDRITFSDAKFLSYANIDKAFLSGLRLASDFDTQKVWLNNNKPNTLATIGIENLNFDLTEYWYDQGASLKFPIALSDTYDKIKMPKTTEELIVAEKIFNFLKIKVGLPIKESTVKSLSVWLSPELINDLEIIKDNEYKPMDFDDLLSLIDVKYESCLKYENEELYTKINEIINNITIPDYQYINKTLEHININNHENKEFYTSFSKELNHLLGLIQSGQWDKSVSDVEIIFDKDNRKLAYNFVSEMFLSLKAPATAINKVVELGGSLSPSTLLNALPVNDIEYLKIINLFDVDWAFEIDGMNALHVAAANNVSQDIIDFLHARGIREKPDSRGLTPNDYMKKLTLNH